MNNRNGLLKPKSSLSDRQEISAFICLQPLFSNFADRILPAPVTGKNFLLAGTVISRPLSSGGEEPVLRMPDGTILIGQAPRLRFSFRRPTGGQ